MIVMFTCCSVFDAVLIATKQLKPSLMQQIWVKATLSKSLRT